jgi:hypothetical protein
MAACSVDASLLYVATTRAKDHLHLILPQRFYAYQQRSNGDRRMYAPPEHVRADPEPDLGLGHDVGGRQRHEFLLRGDELGVDGLVIVEGALRVCRRFCQSQKLGWAHVGTRPRLQACLRG